jgi:hypothetical protein
MLPPSAPFYRKHQHLTIPNKTLSQWLTYQRIHAKTLNELQLTLLDSVKYKEAKLASVCKRNEEAWETKYEELKRFVSENGGVKGLPASLRSWVNRQKGKFQEKSLDVSKQQLLVAIGIDFSGYKERSSSDSRKKKYDAEWQESFEKLRRYRDIHGHCNVPYRFSDPSLGLWVANQRRSYKRLKQQGIEEDDSRIKMLNEIGFEWTCKPKQSKLRNRSWIQRKQDKIKVSGF